MAGGAKLLFNDLPAEQAAMWESRLIGQSHNVEKTVVTQNPCKYIPSTYVICEDDQAVPCQYQEMFASLCGAEVKKCKTGHCPMLSQPEVLAKMIVEVTEKIAQC